MSPAADARFLTSHVVSRGRDAAVAAGEHLGVSGTADANRTGRLVFTTGEAQGEPLFGRTALGFRTWHHGVLVRDGTRVRVHLDGDPAPDPADLRLTTAPR